jgi:hypothetical protein
LHYSENRKKGQFVHVVMPGVVTAIAAWMLDAACCAGMELGDAPGPHCRRLRIWMTSYSTAECGERHLVEEHQNARSPLSPSTVSASAPDLFRTAAFSVFLQANAAGWCPILRRFSSKLQQA